MSVFDDLVGQEAVVAPLRPRPRRPPRRRGGGDGAGDDPRLAVHRAARLRPLGRRPGVRGRAAVPRAAAAATAPPATPALAGTHADVAVVVPEGLSIGVDETRALVLRAARRPDRRPLAGRRSSRTPTGSPSRPRNALLKAIEEPPPRSVFLLCAPSPPRTCCRRSARAAGSCRCARRRPTRSPRCWSRATASTRRWRRAPRAPRRATSAGPARLARDEDARPSGATCCAAARAAGRRLALRRRPRTSSTRPRRRPTSWPADRDAAEREELATALGAGGTGKGDTGGARGRRRRAQGAGEAAEVPGHPHPARRARPRAGRPRRLLPRRARAAARHRRAVLVNGDLTEQAATIARATAAESTLRRIDAGARLPEAIDANVDAAARGRGDGARPAPGEASARRSPRLAAPRTAALAQSAEHLTRNDGCRFDSARRLHPAEHGVQARRSASSHQQRARTGSRTASAARACGRSSCRRPCRSGSGRTGSPPRRRSS